MERISSIRNSRLIKRNLQILSNRLKVFSISLIIIGSLGWFYSYSTSHLTLDQVKELLAEEQLTNILQIAHEVLPHALLAQKFRKHNMLKRLLNRGLVPSSEKENMR